MLSTSDDTIGVPTRVADEPPEVVFAAVGLPPPVTVDSSCELYDTIDTTTLLAVNAVEAATDTDDLASGRTMGASSTVDVFVACKAFAIALRLNCR